MENPDPGIYEVLLGEENSVYSEIQQTEPEGELRLVVGLGGGWVYKFYNSKIPKEIVFFPYNRKYRVYEITFRDNTKPKEKR